MPELIAPTTRLHPSWLDARSEWEPGARQDGTGHRLAEGLVRETPEGFAMWVKRLHERADTSTSLSPEEVHSTNHWIVEDDTYLGAIDLRHDLNDYLWEVGGHVGYSVRPSARGRGHASWALGAVLPTARTLGLDRLLLTCTEDNAASAGVIERNGGVLEGVRDTRVGRLRRYWISL